MGKLSTHQRRARDFVQRENWDAALAELKSAVASDSGNPSLHNQMGDLYLRKEDVSQACHHFENAIDLYTGLGLFNNAVALCRKVLRLSPNRLEVRYRLARLRFEQGLRAEAAASFADYLDHVRAGNEEAVKTLEERCREILERFPEDAPVGKILEKLEESRAFPAAYEIVQRLAQRAADAGDDVAARRYTEKMRSLRVLVGNRRGEDRPEPTRDDADDAAAVVSPSPSQRPQRTALEPGRVDLPAREPAPRDDGPEKSATAKKSAAAERGAAAEKSAADENGAAAVEFVGPAPGRPRSGADAPPAAFVNGGAEPAALADARPNDAFGGIEDDALVIETTAQAQDDGLEGTRASDDSVEFVIETPTPEIEIEIFESEGFARESRAPGSDDLDDTALVFESSAERESEATEVHEYELTDTSLEDVAAMLQEEEERLARQPDAAAAPEEPEADASAEPTARAVGHAAPPDTTRGEHAGRTLPASPAPPTPAQRAAARPAAMREGEFVEPVWIPDDMLEEQLPGQASGQFHELEEVIDTFREQMARALGDDASARYDLGVAYYEMGLYNEALAEFQSAVQHAAIRERCLEMMAACLAMQGRHAEIVSLLSPILDAPGAAGLGPGLRYSMGVACEALGRREEARRHFEEVALVDSGFRDVAMRLQRF